MITPEQARAANEARLAAESATVERAVDAELAKYRDTAVEVYGLARASQPVREYLERKYRLNGWAVTYHASRDQRDPGHHTFVAAMRVRYYSGWER